MKKITLTVLATIFSIALCFAQDIITKKSGEDIKAKVLEVGTSDIKYKLFDNIGGPTYSILKEDVLMIRYENGTKDIFKEEKKAETTSPSKGDLFIQGQADAAKYYDGYRPAGTATLVVSLLSPLIGLVPAIACSSTQPKDVNLNYQNAELIKDPTYHSAYANKAKKIKQGKVWTNWGIAFGVNIVLVILLTSGSK